MIAKAGKLSNREKLIQKLEELTARDLKNMTPHCPSSNDDEVDNTFLLWPYPRPVEARSREEETKAKQAKQEPATPPVANTKPEQAPASPKTIPLLRRGVVQPQVVAKEPKIVDPLAKLQELVTLAQCGDSDALAAIRRDLDANPAIWRNVGDLAAHAEQLLISIIADGNPLVSESMEREVARLKVELAGENPDPLERLTIQRVVACWLHAQYVDRAVLMADATGAKVAAWGKRQEAAQRAYHAALKSLEVVRRLSPRKQASSRPGNVKPVKQTPSPVKKSDTATPVAKKEPSKNDEQQNSPVVNSFPKGYGVPINRFADRLRKDSAITN